MSLKKDADRVSNQTEHTVMEAMQANIIAKIKEFHTDVKKEVSEHAGMLKKEMIREEINVTLNMTVLQEGW